MKPGELQEYFNKKLQAYYDERELKSLFFQVIEFYFHIDRVHFFMDKDRDFKEDDLKILRKAIRQLKEYIPLQYITGTASFFGYHFQVDPSVLIPRPETEELVDLALERIHLSGRKVINFMDIGTGSGCIAITMKMKMPYGKFWACDIDKRALEVARKNADLHKADIHFFNLDIINEDFPHDIPRLHVIISNPPYVRESEVSQMRPNVLNFEPHGALFVPDDDPLLFYRSIAVKAKKHLVKGGFLFFEINEDFGREVTLLLESLGYNQIRIWNDINGKDRFIEALK
jgi:release factor glutamine methyltransferase